MSENNKSIDEIISEFKKQKEERERLEAEEKLRSEKPIDIKPDIIERKEALPKKQNAIVKEEADEQVQEDISPISKLEPPKRREELIDFSENSIDAKSREDSNKKLKKKKLSDLFSKIKRLVFNKAVLVIILIVALALAGYYGINKGIEKSKVSYLAPYQQKYPDVEFPNEIQEQYCELFAQNPEMQAIIRIDSMGIDMQLDSTRLYPVTKGASYHNFVVKLDNPEFEERYSTIQGYNNSDKEIFFTDLKRNYTFEVVGAFYTNTKPEDDNGYVFPYNVTEEMSFDSINQYLDRINSRFLYTVKALDIARQDMLLTIECPTDYKDDYRFVVICKEVEEINDSATAIPKDKVHKTASEYENPLDNPYRFASKWYPEIVITDENGVEAYQQKTIDDYFKQ